jgi:hypothetical protein
MLDKTDKINRQPLLAQLAAAEELTQVEAEVVAINHHLKVALAAQA